MRLEELSALTDCLSFDEHGNVVTIEPVTAIQAHVEAGWRKAAGLAAELEQAAR